MNDVEFTGKIIRQSREYKGWSQLQLADELNVDIRTVKRLEDGIGNHSTELFIKCVVLLNMSADICIYAPHDETGLKMHSLYLQLLDLSPDQIAQVCKSARHKREWADEYPEINSWEKYVEYSNEIHRTGNS